MANSRLERIGTIFSRTNGLIKSGALQWEERPLWFDIYKAFPPKEEPRYDRPIPNIELKEIFYEEDKIRAIFHRNNKHLGSINLFNNNYQTLTQKFINTYKKVQNQYDSNINEEQLYKETVDILKRESETKRGSADEEDYVNLSTTFKEALSKQRDNRQKLNANIRNIFKD